MVLAVEAPQPSKMRCCQGQQEQQRQQQQQQRDGSGAARGSGANPAVSSNGGSAAILGLRQKQQTTVLAEAGVLSALKEHRLAELRSTGRPLESFGRFVQLEEARAHDLGAWGLTLTPLRARHSERAYGLLMERDGRPVLGWTVRVLRRARWRPRGQLRRTFVLPTPQYSPAR